MMKPKRKGSKLIVSADKGLREMEHNHRGAISDHQLLLRRSMGNFLPSCEKKAEPRSFVYDDEGRSKAITPWNLLNYDQACMDELREAVTNFQTAQPEDTSDQRSFRGSFRFPDIEKHSGCFRIRDGRIQILWGLCSTDETLPEQRLSLAEQVTQMERYLGAAKKKAKRRASMNIVLFIASLLGLAGYHVWEAGRPAPVVPDIEVIPKGFLEDGSRMMNFHTKFTRELPFGGQYSLTIMDKAQKRIIQQKEIGSGILSLNMPVGEYSVTVSVVRRVPTLALLGIEKSSEKTRDFFVNDRMDIESLSITTGQEFSENRRSVKISAKSAVTDGEWSFEILDAGGKAILSEATHQKGKDYTVSLPLGKYRATVAVTKRGETSPSVTRDFELFPPLNLNGVAADVSDEFAGGRRRVVITIDSPEDGATWHYLLKDAKASRVDETSQEKKREFSLEPGNYTVAIAGTKEGREGSVEKTFTVYGPVEFTVDVNQLESVEDKKTKEQMRVVELTVKSPVEDGVWNFVLSNHVDAKDARELKNAGKSHKLLLRPGNYKLETTVIQGEGQKDRKVQNFIVSPPLKMKSLSGYAGTEEKNGKYLVRLNAVTAEEGDGKFYFGVYHAKGEFLKEEKSSLVQKEVLEKGNYECWLAPGLYIATVQMVRDGNSSVPLEYPIAVYKKTDKDIEFKVIKYDDALRGMDYLQKRIAVEDKSTESYERILNKARGNLVELVGKLGEWDEGIKKIKIDHIKGGTPDDILEIADSLKKNAKNIFNTAENTATMERARAEAADRMAEEKRRFVAGLRAELAKAVNDHKIANDDVMAADQKVKTIEVKHEKIAGEINEQLEAVQRTEGEIDGQSKDIQLREGEIQKTITKIEELKKNKDYNRADLDRLEHSLALQKRELAQAQVKLSRLKELLDSVKERIVELNGTLKKNDEEALVALNEVEEAKKVAVEVCAKAEAKKKDCDEKIPPAEEAARAADADTTLAGRKAVEANARAEQAKKLDVTAGETIAAVKDLLASVEEKRSIEKKLDELRRFYKGFAENSAVKKAWESDGRDFLLYGKGAPTEVPANEVENMPPTQTDNKVGKKKGMQRA